MIIISLKFNEECIYIYCITTYLKNTTDISRAKLIRVPSIIPSGSPHPLRPSATSPPICAEP